MARTPKTAGASAHAKRTSAVTLVIYEWHESQPGTLAWVFPSLAAALRAVRAMRNAMRWLIVKGRHVGEVADAADGDVAIDVEALRRHGGVLIEHAA